MCTFYCPFVVPYRITKAFYIVRSSLVGKKSPRYQVKRDILSIFSILPRSIATESKRKQKKLCDCFPMIRGKSSFRLLWKGFQSLTFDPEYFFYFVWVYAVALPICFSCLDFTFPGDKMNKIKYKLLYEEIGIYLAWKGSSKQIWTWLLWLQLVFCWNFNP